MPMISMTTSVAVQPEAAERLKAGFGEAITALPGKSEQWLMISIQDQVPMFFQGEKRDCAYLEVSCFGQVAPASYEAMTKLVCELLQKEIAISPEHTYIKYTESQNWGFNLQNL